MPFEITNVYKEHFPALRLIGKRYTNDDRGKDGFGKQWKEWMTEDRFRAMRQAVDVTPFDESTLGLMTTGGDMTDFTYWIGFFFSPDTKKPQGGFLVGGNKTSRANR